MTTSLAAASASVQAPRAPTRADRHQAIARAARSRRGKHHSGHLRGFQQTVVLIPAYNEQEQIAASIESVLAQTFRPDLIVVIADNCTDRTVEIARRYPVQVMETVGNHDKKAGALNQAWWGFCQDARFVITMDADTVLEPRCIERMRMQAVKDPHVGGLCGRPLNKVPPTRMSAWSSMLWHLLALDFAMYDQTLVHRKYQTEVLGGFGSLFRNRALKDVAERYGNPWATDSIVEDYRLSLKLREASWKILVSPHALAYTDTPVTLRSLWQQRLRWSGGTFQELLREGWKPWTRRGWLNYSLIWFGVLLRVLVLFAWALIMFLHLPMTLSWYVLAPCAVAAADRLVVSLRMRHRNWRTHLLAVTVLPLELLTTVGQAWALRSSWLVLRRKGLRW